ncbi:MAG: protein jag [Spirochaetales bacterium]|nr:protein jag [Spirochaetales bacterium]
MAMKIFTGVSEGEAVKIASLELGIPAENLKYEVVDVKKKGLFSKGEVRIGVEVAGDVAGDIDETVVSKVQEFISNVVDKMELDGKVSISSAMGNKICLAIESEDSRILIGKKGKTLDALQVLANSVAQNLSQNGVRTIIDCENYRQRRQEKILDFAEQVADTVRRTRSSRLLEPMNPYERRLIHTALTRYSDIETVSEGEGLYKQVRVRYRSRDYS